MTADHLAGNSLAVQSFSLENLDHVDRSAEAVERRAAFVAHLRRVLPLERLALARDEREAAATDRSGIRLPGSPVAVAFPESIEEVQILLRAATSHRVPVIPRGGGTGLSGAAVASDGSLVISTERLTRILEISPDDEIAVVQPGVLTADLDRAVARHGLMYAPDPASHEISTIGGNIATNAGGLHCTKYGVTRESVLGLTVVLADGTLLHTGRRTIKGVTGFDLTGLFVGSEGTLGIVVQATLRLRPRPVKTTTLTAFFPSSEAAAHGVTAIVRSRVQASVLEFLDSGALRAIDTAQQTDLATRGTALLIAQTDGYGADLEADVLAAALTEVGAAVEVLDELQAGRYLWLRRSGRGPFTDTWFVGEDVAVPRSVLAEMITTIGEIGERHGLEVAVVAHAGDGNLHPMLSVAMSPVDGGSPPARLHQAADELVRAALALGGTISGEHGVGIAKRPWLSAEIGDTSLQLQRRLAEVFDPAGILVPHTWLART
ncbi:glycolate oxidase [Nakamurella sp. UYEF19]|uniref:FAD-binding oxidoreductase n=1 Tax=Nakamurella sp. UYEF19 TaxID=1756392 RepID=UPI003393062B